MRSLILALVIAAVAELPDPPKAPACAAAPRRGESFDVNSEEAIIFYDSKTKTEHFIRRANFRTEAKDFGFLVPTPTKPELGEARSFVFDTLDTATLPRRVESGNVQRIVQKRNQTGAAARAEKAPAAPVILDRKKVAGYDAIVLQADDVEGLKKWLEENQYDARPELMTWLKWYVEHKWIITAFKILQEPSSNSDRWAKSVRMSFQTDKPFYPYREPEDMRSKASPTNRKLRVFFLSDARYEGAIGKERIWPARTEWANVLPEHSSTNVTQGLGMTEAETKILSGQRWYLTEFVDQSSPRPGTDEIYFKKSNDQTPVERPVVLYDRYEYVYEDELPFLEQTGGTIWLVLGGAVVLGMLLLGIGFLIVLKKSPRGS